MSEFTSSSSASPIRDSATRLRRVWRRGWTPPARISIPDWADRTRRLARESGSSAGRWRTSKVEIARGPLLAPTEPGVHVVTCMVATQLLKTSVLENIFGFHADLDPCPILLVQPKEAAAEQFSKERITPMIRATPALRELIGTAKTRNADETLTYKSFPGGFLALVGAGSPDNLARRPVRIVLYDEVDKYPVTREGDPIDLGDERTATFVNWLSVRVCSPTVEGESRIETSWLASDQRRAALECAHCGHWQFPEFFAHVEWPAGEPRRALVHCEACGAAWSEPERLAALQTAQWRQTASFECCGARQSPLEAYSARWREEGSPGAVEAVWDLWEGDRWSVWRAKCAACGAWAAPNEHAGFQAGKLYSPWPKDSPGRQAEKWLASRADEDKRQTWWNTQQGLPYRRHTAKELKSDVLAARGEVWDAEVPAGVAVLTAGVDVQDYRIEVEIVGWGANEESWSIAQEVIDGEMDDPAIAERLDAFLRRTWSRADGRSFPIQAACIDSGGHHTQAVYEFAKARLGRRLWAIKGESARAGAARNPVWPAKRPSKRSKKSFRPIILGVNAAKDSIRDRLLKTVSETDVTSGPGYMHFPADRDVGWFDQLTAERLELREFGGRRYRVWAPIAGRANEALDCRVYAYGALCGLVHMGLRLNRLAEEIAGWRPPEPPSGPPDGPDPGSPADPSPPRAPPPPSPAPSSPPKPDGKLAGLVKRLA